MLLREMKAGKQINKYVTFISFLLIWTFSRSCEAPQAKLSKMKL